MKRHLRPSRQQRPREKRTIDGWRFFVVTSSCRQRSGQRDNGAYLLVCWLVSYWVCLFIYCLCTSFDLYSGTVQPCKQKPPFVPAKAIALVSCWCCSKLAYTRTATHRQHKPRTACRYRCYLCGRCNIAPGVADQGRARLRWTYNKSILLSSQTRHYIYNFN